MVLTESCSFKSFHRQEAGKERPRSPRLLRERLIEPQTLARYRASAAAFFNFCSNAGYSKPHTAPEMDLRICEFVEHSWEEGDSRNMPADARSGLRHFLLLCVGNSLAVGDFYGHGAQMSCRCEPAPCRSIFCLPWSALRSKHKNCESQCRF